MNYNFLPQLTPLYNKYNNIIKPLVAEIEVRFEEFPTSIFNEIRAFNDHISRCFLKPEDDEWITVQLNKANGHIERIIGRVDILGDRIIVKLSTWTFWVIINLNNVSLNTHL